MMSTTLHPCQLSHSLARFSGLRCSLARTFAADAAVPVRQFPRHLQVKRHPPVPCSASTHKASARVQSTGDAEPRSFQGVQKMRSGRYLVRITVDGATRNFGSFDTAEEAARHRDMHILRFYGTLDQAPQRTKLNFPLSTYIHRDVMKLKSLEQYRQEWAATAEQESRPTSGFHGVYWRDERGKWKAQVTLQGRRVSGGLYNTEEEAARKYDELAYRLLGDRAVLNFDQDIEKYKAAAAEPVPEKVKTSQYKGVSYAGDRNLWLAKLHFGGKVVYSKRFRTEEEAARAYDQAVMQLLPQDIWATRLNFPEVPR